MEVRDCPANMWWTGQYGTSFPGQPGHYSWKEGETPAVAVPANRAPTADDDLYFDGRVSSNNCDWGSGVGTPKSVHLINGYTGTVRVAPISTPFLDLQSGNIDQASTAVIQVTSQMYWTGGVLDSSTHSPSTLVLTGSGTVATILTRDGPGTTALQTADTIRAENGARVEFGFGTVRFNAGGGLDLTGPTTTANVKVTPSRQLVLENAVAPAHAADVYLTDGAKYTVAVHTSGGSGSHTSGLAFRNEGGQLSIDSGIQMTVSGSIPGPGPVSAGIRQSSGGTRLSTQSALVVPAGVAYTGGTFTTYVGLHGTTAVIQGDMYNNGAHVQFTKALPNSFGTLEVRGTVGWGSGIYLPWIGMINGQRQADLWKATEQITVGTQASVSHVGADIGSDIPVGTSVVILQSDAQIVGGPPAKDLNDARYSIHGINDPVNQWVLRRDS